MRNGEDRKVEDEDYTEETAEDDGRNSEEDEESNKVVDRPNKWAASSSGNSVLSSSREFQSKMGSEGGQLHVKHLSNEASLARSSSILGTYFFIWSKLNAIYICLFFVIHTQINIL